MKEMKTTAQVLVDCLEAEGVDVMFGIPGEETLDLMFAIRDSKIRFIPAGPASACPPLAPVLPTLSPVWRMLIWTVRLWWPSPDRSAPTGCSSPATSTLT